jgi:hypothetical protein
MPLQCNIDSRGKAVRLVYGAVLLFAGVAMALFWALPTGSAWGWVISVLAVVSGAFALFEARAGWCVVRALGFKTPI